MHQHRQVSGGQIQNTQNYTTQQKLPRPPAAANFTVLTSENSAKNTHMYAQGRDGFLQNIVR